MSIKYNTVRKVHLYACLSTTALLLMFLVTSFIMVHHDIFDHESKTESKTISYKVDLTSLDAKKKWLKELGIPGRLVKSSTNPVGNEVLEYDYAAGNSRITFLPKEGLLEVMTTTKSKADAIVGVHRQRGYGGSLKYKIHAFLLDVMAISLLLFVLTGLYMWMRWYKKDKWVWIVFFGGMAYFGTFLLYFTFA